MARDFDGIVNELEWVDYSLVENRTRKTELFLI